MPREESAIGPRNPDHSHFNRLFRDVGYKNIRVNYSSQELDAFIVLDEKAS